MRGRLDELDPRGFLRGTVAVACVGCTGDDAVDGTVLRPPTESGFPPPTNLPAPETVPEPETLPAPETTPLSIFVADYVVSIRTDHVVTGQPLGTVIVDQPPVGPQCVGSSNA